MDIKIFEGKAKNYEFWGKMGPFFASRSIRREMPYLIDDDHYIWFVSFNENAVSGFSACHIDKKNIGHLHGIYVVDEHRRKGIAMALVKSRLEFMRKRGCREFHASASPKSRSILDQIGFTQIGMSGQYAKMILKEEQ